MKKVLFSILLIYFYSSSLAQCGDSTLLLDVSFSNGFIDESVYSNVGTASSTLILGKDVDRFGDSTSYHWNGLSDILSYPGSSDLRVPLPLTVSMWIKLDTIGVKHSLFSNEDRANLYSGVWISVNATGNIEANAGYGAVGPTKRYTETSTTVLNKDKWYHVVCVYEPGAVTNVYINGVKETTIRSGTSTTMTYFYSTDVLRIGYSNISTPIGCKGNLDDVKYWKKGLTDTEVEELYISTKAIDSSLVVYRSFTNSDADESFYNQPVYANTASLTTDKFGNPNSAYEFNGSTRIVGTYTNPSLQVNFPCSFSLWVNPTDSSENSFIYTNNDDNGQYSGFWIKSPATGQVEFSFGNGTPGSTTRKTATTNGVLRSNKWQHIVCIAHSYDSLDVFIDTVKNNVTYSGTATSVSYIQNFPGSGESIGGMRNGTATLKYFTGKIDEIKVWNRAISKVEIKKEYSLAAKDLIAQDTLKMCNVETVTLNAANGYDYYSWSTGDNTSTATFTNSNVGISTITVEGCSKGLKTKDTVILKVSPASTSPTINFQSTSICKGEQVTFIASPTSEVATYLWKLWKPGGTPINVSVDSSYITDSLMDGDKVFGEVKYYCNSLIWRSLSTITMNVYDKPNDTIEVTNFGVTLNSKENQASYQWVNCNNNYSFLINDTNQNFTATTNGNYAVIVDNGVCPADTSDCVLVSSVGLDKNSKDIFKIYPNPFNDIINVETNNQNPYLMEIRDVTGKLILKKQIINKDKIKVDGPKGLYILTINSGTEIFVKRLVKN